MAYNGNIAAIPGIGEKGNRIWLYTETADDLATIKGSGYFDAATGKLRQYDQLIVIGSNGSEIINVTSASGAGTVTTTGTKATATVGTGDITSDMILNNTIVDGDISNSAGVQVSKLEAMSNGQFIVGNGGTATLVSMSGDATLDNTGALSLAANSVGNTEMQDNAIGGAEINTYAVDDVGAGSLQVLTFDTAGGASDDLDKTLTYKITIVGAWVINKAAGTPGDTIQLQTAAGAANITDVINVGGVANTRTDADNILTANSVIAAGGTLRIAQVDGSGSDSPACRVVVVGFKTA